MNIVNHLSSSLGERTQLANQTLAQEIVRSQNHDALDQLIKLLSTDQKTDILADTLKVLEVIGELDSQFASRGFDQILIFLNHKSNKIQWRAMSALSTIAAHHIEKLYNILPQILEIMHSGTVVTRDHGVKILLTLYSQKNLQNEIAPLLAEQVLGAPDNQVGQYAEKWSKIVSKEHMPLLIETLGARSQELEKPSHQHRASKILLKLNKRLN